MTQVKSSVWMMQTDLLQQLAELGTGAWVVVQRRVKSDSESYSFRCAIVPNALIEQEMRSSGWSSLGDWTPSFSVSNESGEEVATYHRFGDVADREPLVVNRSFHGIRQGYVEIVEEFRLFHNLYHDGKTGKYIKIDGSGDEEEVVIVDGESVRIRLKHIRQYLAAKDASLIVLFDLRRFSPLTPAELGLDEGNEDQTRPGLTYYRTLSSYRGLSSDTTRCFSRLVGKKLITGGDLESCGIWPFDEEEQEYEEFSIATNAEGNPVLQSCNPDVLANYFGANPEAPHYLTPVFFRRDVLQKYYSQSSRYRIEDNAVWCGNLWMLRIDNNHPTHVVAYLGDLGRDLRHKEQVYWKSFNVAPEGGVSEVEFKRAFLAEFADPAVPDLRFKYVFEQFQEPWRRSFAWDLFRPFHEQDQHLYTALRVPLTNDQSEFDQQVLALTKLLIDSLNEKELEKGAGSKVENEKGIAKLARFLAAKGVIGFDPHIQFLRDLQTLRSTSVGHRKGTDFDKLSSRLGLDAKPLSEVFKGLLVSATCLIEYLQAQLAPSEPPGVAAETPPTKRSD